MGFIHVLLVLAAAAFAALIAWFLTRRKFGSEIQNARFEPPLLIFVGLVALVMTAVFIGGLFGWIRVKDGVMDLVLGLVAAAFCIAVFLDCCTRRIVWNDGGAIFTRWNGRQTKAWNEIESVESKEALQHWRVGFRDGSGFALYLWMAGSADFLVEAAARGVPGWTDSEPD